MVKEESRGKKRIITDAVLLAVLVFAYFFSVFIMPDVKLFSTTKVLSGDPVSMVELGGDKVIAQSFSMPFSRVSAIAPYFRTDEKKDGTQVWIELYDDAGTLVYSKQISKQYLTHAYEKVDLGKYISVHEQKTYTLRIWADTLEKSGVYVAVSDKAMPGGVMCYGEQEAEGSLYLEMDGGFTGQSNKTPFLIFYLLFAVIFLLCSDALVSGSVSLHYDKTELLDKVVVGVLLLYCALCISETNDIQVIVRGSSHLIDAIGKGHLRDFYDYTCTQELAAGTFGDWAFNYNILQYVFVAICILPFKYIIPMETAFYLYYIQVIVAALMLYCGHLLKSVTKAFGFDASFQRTVPFLFLTSGMGIFAIVGFGQIDVVFVVLLLWALRFYAEKKYYRFSALMAVAIAYKSFPILLFIPMILLTNKRIREIAINGAIGVSVTLVTGLLFNGSEGYKAMQKIADNEQHFMEKLTLSRIENGGMYGIALFILIFVLICAFAYMKDVSRDDLKETYAYLALIGFLVYVDIFCFLIWHIPWLMPMALFTAMLIPLFPKAEPLLVMETLMEMMALLVAEIWNLPNIGMLDYGAQTTVWETAPYRGPELGGITANLSSASADLAFACMTGVLLFMSVYFIKEMPQMIALRKKTASAIAVPRNWAWGRIGIVVLYSVFSLWCFYYIG